MYILIVDDDQLSSALMELTLRKEGYEVAKTDNPRSAMQMIQKEEPDLLLLNVTMPYMDGFTFAAKLRDEGYEIPLIFVTARDAIAERLRGFKLGADDYICKPFHYQKLVASVQAVIRRIKKNVNMGNQSIRSGQIELLPAELKVLIPGRPAILLTPTEMHVLRVLMAYPSQVVNRDRLLWEVWNEDQGNSNIIDVYIRRLRMKLEADLDNPQHIISVRGVGYKFVGK